MPAAAGRRRGRGSLRGAVTAIDAAPVAGRIERRDGRDVRHDHHAAAGRRHAGDLPGRHRQRQCRARVARAQRGAGRRRRIKRLRPPRLLRAALAADQHHRLHAFPRRRRRRRAQRQAARICRLHQGLLGGAARHHQQHSRSRHHRRRRDEAQARRRRHPRQTMEAAAEGVQDRLAEDHLKFDISAAADIGSFDADERRVRQVLFNLLSNAIGFSAGRTVTLAAERRADDIVFKVTDRGRGIPPEVARPRCSTASSPTRWARHRGPGSACRSCAPSSNCTAAR